MENFRDYLKWARELQEGRLKLQGKATKTEQAATKIEKNRARLRGYDATSLPFLDKNNDLIIPHLTSMKYRYWLGGQSVLETLLELGAGEDILERYASNWRERLERKRWGN